MTKRWHVSRTHKRFAANNFPALIILILMLLATIGAYLYVWDNQEKRSYTRFENLAAENEQALRHRLDNYEHALLGGVGYFNGSNYISRTEWGIYVNELDIIRRLPGINGVGFIANVSEIDLKPFLSEAKDNGFSEFEIKPEIDRPEKYIVKYIEPENPNLAAIGLNIAFEENRRAAANYAIETGNSAITDSILLVQDSQQTPGFLLLTPVYRNALPIDTAEERRTAHYGWVYAPFIANNFLRRLTLSQGELIKVEVYDGDQVSEDFLFYSDSDSDSDSDIDPEPATATNSQFTITKSIAVFQHEWSLVWTSTQAFESAQTNATPLIILAVGLILTGLMAIILMRELKRSTSIQEQVIAKTQEIEEGNVKLRSIVNTVADGIITMSNTGIVTAFNPAAEKIFLYSADEVIGQNVKVLMPDPYHSEHDMYLDNYKRTGTRKIIGAGRTVEARRKDGSVFPMDLAVNQLSVGNEHGYVGSIKDVSEREQAKKKLIASEQTFRQSMEQASIGMALVSLDGRTIRSNDAIRGLLGYSEIEFEQLTSNDIVHADDLEADRVERKNLTEQKASAYTIEKRLIGKNKNVIWVQQSTSLVRNTDGNPEYFVVQVVDLTERHKMDQMKSEFISTVSHELRTPLTSIRGSLGLIIGAMADNVPSNIMGMITIAHKNSERLISLVNDILDMDKLESGQMHFEIKQELLAPLLQSIWETNRVYAENFDVLLVLEPIPDGIRIDIDSMRLNQVLTNLISNAVKFSNGGAEVKIVTEVKGDRVRMNVVDYGIGISQEFRSRIFTKFAQEDASTTKAKGGTGLGLMISKQLTEQMNGEIGFESELGKGTTFWFDIAISLEEYSQESSLG